MTEARMASRHKLLAGAAALYGAVVVASVAALFLIPVFPTFMEGDRMASGCYITEAFLAGASCHGFPGSDAAAVMLQIPFHLVLGPVFALGALASGEVAASIHGALYLIFSVALWAPFVYLWRATRPVAPADGPA
jgi:hypothetical protein